jgi:hypothetical protein
MLGKKVLKFLDDGIELFGLQVHQKSNEIVHPALPGMKIITQSPIKFLTVGKSQIRRDTFNATEGPTRSIAADERAGDLDQVKWVGLSAYHAAMLYFQGILTRTQLENAKVVKEDGVTLIVIEDKVQFGQYSLPVKIGAEETVGYQKGRPVNPDGVINSTWATLTSDNVIVGTTDKWTEYSY